MSFIFCCVAYPYQYGWITIVEVMGSWNRGVSEILGSVYTQTPCWKSRMEMAIVNRNLHHPWIFWRQTNKQTNKQTNNYDAVQTHQRLQEFLPQVLSAGKCFKRTWSQPLFHTQKTTLLNVINATFSPSPAISRKYPLTKHLFPTAFPPDDPLYYVSAGLVASTPYTP